MRSCVRACVRARVCVLQEMKKSERRKDSNWQTQMERETVKVSELSSATCNFSLMCSRSFKPRKAIENKIKKMELTMCRAANTPSTTAQQKAATTPKLINTMAATNWKQKKKEAVGNQCVTKTFYEIQTDSKSHHDISRAFCRILPSSPLLSALNDFQPRTDPRPDFTLYEVHSC